MSKLTELFKAVQEPNLTRYQLEEFRDQLADLKGQMHLEMADLKTKKAIYESQQDGKKQTEIDRVWNATPDGLRMLQTKEYIRATGTKLSALKDRLYIQY